MTRSEQTFLVTGASSGLGQETARVLAHQGARVVLVSRGSGAGAEVTETLRRESGNDELHFLPADLSSPAEIRRIAAEFHERFGQLDVLVNDELHFLPADLSSPAEIRRIAAEFHERFGQLDVLVNNAGAFFSSRTLTADGFETTFALNHLSYFLLTHLLLGRLLRSPAPRVVNVASRAEGFSRIHFDDLMLTRNYGGWRAYGQSKLANLLFSYRLARVLAATPVTVNALHPGTVATGIGGSGRASSLLLKFVRPFLKTPAQGARTVLYLAASPEVAGVSGRYFIDKKPATSSKRSHDREAQRRLWRLSRELVGLSEAEEAPLKQVTPAHERINL